jgi:histone H3/H4
MGDADRLPMANVSRIIAQTLPKDAAVSKEARVALSACATVFVHYITELYVPRPAAARC